MCVLFCLLTCVVGPLYYFLLQCTEISSDISAVNNSERMSINIERDLMAEVALTVVTYFDHSVYVKV